MSASPPSPAPLPLPGKTIALVGLMGVGKSSVGKRLATLLDCPFVDADDLWPPDKLSCLGPRLEADPSLDVVTGRIQYVPMDGALWLNYRFERPDNTVSHIHLGAALYRRRAFERIGGFGDEWTLIRTREGFCGWVLRNRLALSIPDEILQYAEGKRITSYFKIGETRDKDGPKAVWLWTTVDRRSSDADFDTIRVFVWSTRRHRYETGLIERNWKGLFPISVAPVPPLKSARGAAGLVPGFVIQGEKGNGRRVRRSYAMINDRIRLSAEEPLPSAEGAGGGQ